MIQMPSEMLEVSLALSSVQANMPDLMHQATTILTGHQQRKLYSYTALLVG